MSTARGAALLLLVALTAACGGDDEPCDDFHEVMTRISEPPPAAYAAEMADCELYFKRCLVVCQHVLRDQHLTLDDSAIEECMVKHDSTGHDVTVGYSDGACAKAANPASSTALSADDSLR